MNVVAKESHIQSNLNHKLREPSAFPHDPPAAVGGARAGPNELWGGLWAERFGPAELPAPGDGGVEQWGGQSGPMRWPEVSRCRRDLGEGLKSGAMFARLPAPRCRETTR